MGPKTVFTSMTSRGEDAGAVAGALAACYVLAKGVPLGEALRRAYSDMDDFAEANRLPQFSEVTDEIKRKSLGFWTAYFARGHAICTGEDQT